MGNKHVPVLAIPTTSGTGSESTASAILTNHEEKTKISIKPRVYCEKAFINFRYTYRLSNEITASTAVDVLSHLIDGYMSAQANMITDHFAEGGFYRFSKCLPALKAKDYNDIFRDEIQLISIIGGIVIANTRTTLPHLMSYPLTYDKKVPHGFACGLLTYEFLQFHQDKNKISRMLSLCGFESLDKLGSFLSSICPAVICGKSEISTYSQIVYSDQERLKLHPYEVRIEDIINIYRQSLTR